MKTTTTGGIDPARRVDSATAHAGSSSIKLLVRFAAVLGSVFVTLAACAAVSLPPISETTWSEIARRVTEYAAKPSPATTRAALNVIPETPVSLTGSFGGRSHR